MLVAVHRGVREKVAIFTWLRLAITTDYISVITWLMMVSAEEDRNYGANRQASRCGYTGGK